MTNLYRVVYQYGMRIRLFVSMFCSYVAGETARIYWHMIH